MYGQRKYGQKVKAIFFKTQKNRLKLLIGR